MIEASHPVPDANSERGARRLLERVRGLGPDDLVLALISGGGSALCAAPAPGLTLADKQAINRALLASGANISEMNCVRKHLSAIKGGRLAAAARPARVVTLAISDVPGDDPAVIASGPTVPDPTTFADARAIIARYGIEPSAAVAARLEQATDETPKPDDLPNSEFRLIATPMMALSRMAEVARGHGPRRRSSWAMRWKAKRARWASCMAGIARSIRTHGQPLAPPAVMLSGGETTVTLGRGPAGHGGRNTEFLLSLAVALGGAAGIWAIAGDTDGMDGMDDIAGAIADAGHAGAGARQGARPARDAGRPRQPHAVRRHRRRHPHRPHADQCQRCPRHPDRLKDTRWPHDRSCAAAGAPRSSPRSAPPAPRPRC